MSPEPDRSGMPSAAASSTTAHGKPWSAPSRMALGVLGILIVTISLLGGTANAAVTPVANQPVTAVTDDGAHRAAPELAGAAGVGDDDPTPSGPALAIGAQETEDDTEDSEGKGRRKFVIGGVLAAIVVAAVVVLVLRRRGDDEY